MWIDTLLNYAWLFGTMAVLLLVGVAIVVFIWGKPVLMIYMQIAYCCFNRYLIEQFGFPENIKYFCDLLTVTLLLQMLRRGKQPLRCDTRRPMAAFVLYTAAVLVSTLGNMAVDLSGFPFFVWHILVYFRYYVFFWACIVYLTKEDIDRILRFLLALLPLNAALCSFQYFVQGLTFDYNGGIFGILRGCNGPMSIYLFIIIPVLTVQYVKGKAKLPHTVLGLAMVLYIAALSELKIMFLVVPILMLLVMLMFPGRKSFALTITSLVLLSLSMSLFLLLYPNWEDFFTLDAIQSYAVEEGYSGEGSLSRMNAAVYIMENILKTPVEKLFGIGSGKSWFAFGQSSAFFREYAHLRFSVVLYSMQLIELGIVGLAAYVNFFFAAAQDCWRMARRADRAHASYGYISMAVALLSVLLILYNTALRQEIAYIYYFAMAFPYIVQKELPLGAEAEAQKGNPPVRRLQWQGQKSV